MIFNVSGGGGTALNFRVVGGTEAPANPAANCIWVNTDVDITGWVFSAEEPSPAEPDMVWIRIDTSSSVAFNALKKNGVMVYPMSAKQYVSGAWGHVPAKIYQGSAWVDWWDGELFVDGNTWDAITGGWVGYPNLAIESRSYASAGVVTEDTLVLSIATADKSENITTANPFNLTNFSHLAFTITNWGGSGTGYAFFFEDGATSWVSRVAITANGDYTLAVPAGGGEYRIGFGVSTSGATRGFNVTEARLIA